MKYRPEFFQPKEFRCPCCGGGQLAALLVFFLDMVRRAWDGPVIVNSGYRCERHNAEVGRVANSRHLLGCAADVRPRDPELIEPFRSLLSHTAGQLEGWELRLYPRFVHVAVPREEAARPWDGGLVDFRVK